ncbi:MULTISPECIES: ABC transporter ATP-binding protein [Paenibacillus]|jgi:putative ABC transport system ATP-binding protein|uniref:ATP-binding cassette domain-containing protein n=1 Tax=Paenibacillus phytohabitans TaxID=2654978 RepID=A0ABX1YP14_9BACL|nr:MULTISPECIES: ABC transporter ATP-binding protein [Paenibacillus]NOU81394.1 ATP-binding cassette domain-containing protein [Paenibacillus phytohabitans]OMF33275.1 macrolide ABC transporter ATP-binding protein [Paenibacillus sp. FSL H8-0259]
MSTSEPLIRVQNMQHSYTMAGESMAILKGLTFNIDYGEFVAIIGPSGSGKSTLMNMLGCLDVANEGDYFLDGQEIRKLSDNKLAQIRNEKIGFIFQNFNLLPKLSAVENVELPLIYRGMSHRERREVARNALVRVGLESRIDHRPSELSGGQQQRVAIARALAGTPPILLADEPTGALDSKTGKEVLEMIKALNEQGHTIILITHDLEIAEQAKRIIRIQDGDLVEDRKVSHS